MIRPQYTAIREIFGLSWDKEYEMLCFSRRLDWGDYFMFSCNSSLYHNIAASKIFTQNYIPWQET